MTERHTSTPDSPEAGRYEIRLTGHLDARWTAWFDGLTVSHESDGTTVISGQIADQAALHGLLQRVRDLGLPSRVTRVEPSKTTSRPPNRPGATAPLPSTEREGNDMAPTLPTPRQNEPRWTQRERPRSPWECSSSSRSSRRSPASSPTGPS